MLCGRRPCRLQPSDREQRQQPCPAGRECLKHSYLTCFSPPCHQWGVCAMAGPSPPQVTTKCQPNGGHLDNSCVRITLVFNRDKVPPVSHILSYSISCFGHAAIDSLQVVVFVLPLITIFLCSCPGNNSGEHLLRAEVSSRHQSPGERPRPSPALRPIAFESGCRGGGSRK